MAVQAPENQVFIASLEAKTGNKLRTYNSNSGNESLSSLLK